MATRSLLGGVMYQLVHGGEGGIRTLGIVSDTPVFKTGTLNHSVTSPGV